jgi:hypothetical protein
MEEKKAVSHNWDWGNSGLAVGIIVLGCNFLPEALESRFPQAILAIGAHRTDEMVGRHIWLRAEASVTRPSRGDPANLETDRRTPLVPADAHLLVEAGYQVGFL